MSAQGTRPRREGEGANVATDVLDVPAGTIGFEAVGEVEDDDWEQAVEPVLRREIADGRQVRLLYLLGSSPGTLRATR